MLIQPRLLSTDSNAGVALELTAIDLERRTELTAAAKLEPEALVRFIDADAGDDGPPLSPDERASIESRLHDLRESRAPARALRPFELELRRARFVREVAERGDPELSTLAAELPLLASRDRLVLSPHVYESLLWTLVPALRRERSSFLMFPDWVRRDREITTDDRAVILNASPGFRALAGNTQIAGLEPSRYGYLRYVPNVTRAEDLRALQSVFEAALPSDLAALLPEWRSTFPGAYHDLKMRFALADEHDAETIAFGASLLREADWYFAHAMSEVHHASMKLRTFRLRAERRGWAVVSTDGFDA